jgi:addiction module HigA family antidote
MSMYNPPHPGGAVLELCMKPLGLTVGQTAEALGVSRRTLSELINGHRSISTEMAERLALAFGGEAILWLNMQTQYDLWQLKHSKKKLNVQKLYKKAS